MDFSYDAFASITLKSGIKSSIKPPPPPATVILDAHTFDDVVFVSSLATFHLIPFPTWVLDRTKIMTQLSLSLHLGVDTARV
jgi:hypothetical protein